MLSFVFSDNSQAHPPSESRFPCVDGGVTAQNQVPYFPILVGFLETALRPSRAYFKIQPGTIGISNPLFVIGTVCITALNASQHDYLHRTITDDRGTAAM